MILWRPVGMHELQLIYDAEMSAFPQRLPDQPFFYPVLNLSYAIQIARDWNTKKAPFAGYVTRFEIDDPYSNLFEVHVAGGPEHREFWVPAEQLSDFNSHIVGPISVVSAYFGHGFQGHIPSKFMLKDKPASQQLRALAEISSYNKIDFYLETQANELTIFLNFPFWLASAPPAFELQPEVIVSTLEAIRYCWQMRTRKVTLIEHGECAA